MERSASTAQAEPLSSVDAARVHLSLRRKQLLGGEKLLSLQLHRT